MFDNLKHTIEAAESVLSVIKHNKEMSQSTVEYWNKEHINYSAENPEADDSYYIERIDVGNKEIEIYNEIEKTVTALVRQALK